MRMVLSDAVGAAGAAALAGAASDAGADGAGSREARGSGARTTTVSSAADDAVVRRLPMTMVSSVDAAAAAAAAAVCRRPGRATVSSVSAEDAAGSDGGGRRRAELGGTAAELSERGVDPGLVDARARLRLAQDGLRLVGVALLELKLGPRDMVGRVVGADALGLHVLERLATVLWTGRGLEQRVLEPHARALARAHRAKRVRGLLVEPAEAHMPLVGRQVLARGALERDALPPRDEAGRRRRRRLLAASPAARGRASSGASPTAAASLAGGAMASWRWWRARTDSSRRGRRAGCGRCGGGEADLAPRRRAARRRGVRVLLVDDVDRWIGGEHGLAGQHHLGPPLKNVGGDR